VPGYGAPDQYQQQWAGHDQAGWSDHQWTPEQIAAWEAQQAQQWTPAQIAAWEAQQARQQQGWPTGGAGGGGRYDDGESERTQIRPPR
jgi:hypothetical protein